MKHLICICLVFLFPIRLGAIERVSISSGGIQGNGYSYSPAISADGRFIVFNSFADNLVSEDTNESSDVFVHDRNTGITARVSVDTRGVQGNSNSNGSSISADGRFVIFRSWATNLVEEDTNGKVDVFVHELSTKITTRVSVATDGTQGNGDSMESSISADGLLVTFDSFATNLIGLMDTNGTQDIFVHELSTKTTTRVSVDTRGMQGNGYSNVPAISADGRFIAFNSGATNLTDEDTNGITDIFIHDRTDRTTSRIAVEYDAFDSHISLSADGNFVVFDPLERAIAYGDPRAIKTIFVHDRSAVAGAATVISVAPDGAQANGQSDHPSFNGDGSLVVFGSVATNLVEGDTNGVEDIFVIEYPLSVTPPPVSDIAGRYCPRSNDCDIGLILMTIEQEGGNLTFTGGFGYMDPPYNAPYSGTATSEGLTFTPGEGISCTATVDGEGLGSILSGTCTVATSAESGVCSYEYYQISAGGGCPTPPSLATIHCCEGNACVSREVSASNACSNFGLSACESGLDCVETPPPPDPPDTTDEPVRADVPPIRSPQPEPYEPVPPKPISICNMAVYQCNETTVYTQDDCDRGIVTCCRVDEDCQDEPVCDDSDDGKSPGTAGVVNQYDSAEDTSATPYRDCCGHEDEKNGTRLREFYCNPETNMWEGQIYICNDGCEARACKRDPHTPWHPVSATPLFYSEVGISRFICAP